MVEEEEEEDSVSLSSGSIKYRLGTWAVASDQTFAMLQVPRYTPMACSLVNGVSLDP